MPLMQNPPGSFTLVIMASRLARNWRREARTFSTSNDRATSSCSEASSYSLYNGQLFVQFAYKTTEQFSTTTGISYADSSSSSTPGGFITTFSLSNTGSLLWTNNRSSIAVQSLVLCPLASLWPSWLRIQSLRPCVFIDLTIVECQYPCMSMLLVLDTDDHPVTSCVASSSSTDGILLCSVLSRIQA